ncbi:MAG: hypothetical protein WC332_00555 [Clostridia bacterium]|jgi:hypothetical protein
MRFELLETLSADELNQQELDRRAEQSSSSEVLVDGLNQLINKKWTDAKEAKRPIEKEMLDSVYQRKGKYSPEKLAKIKAVEQPEIFLNITETKCANAIYQIKDIISQPGKRIFSVKPTTIPELPQAVVLKIQQGVLNMYIQMAVNEAMQSGQQIPSSQLREMIVSKSEEIKEKVHQETIKTAKNMAAEIEDKIDDDFIQGGFYKAMDDVIDDIVSLKAGIIKGAIFRNERVKKTVQDPSGRLSKQIETRIVPQWERRSPFSIFPSPRSTGVHDGYLFDVITLRPKQLYDLIGVEGFNETEIRAVLKEFQEGTLKNDWLELSQETKEGMGDDPSNTSPYENIYCLELWDEISGKPLREWGLTVDDEDNEYPVCVWKIGNHVIKAMLNYDTMGKKPFNVTSFHKVNDSFWNKGIPEVIEDCQQVCNACGRAIVANVGLGSLPMVDLNVDRLEVGASRKVWPGRIFLTTNEEMGSGSKAVNFYQPQMVTEKLITVYNTFSRIADEHSGVPSFEHGGNVGAASNSSGLHQMREMANRGIRGVVRNIDLDIIVPITESHYDYLLDNQDIYGLVGDYKMVAEGTSALAAKEQLTMRKNEYVQATSNPVDIQLIGSENRRKMLFSIAKDLGLEIDEELKPVPVQPQLAPPPPSPATLDESGNPVKGTDNRSQSPKAPVGQVSRPGDGVNKRP